MIALNISRNMSNNSIQSIPIIENNVSPDAPFHSGVSGKYKLLIISIEFKYGNYE